MGNNMGEKFKFERKERIRKDVYDMVSMCLSESISGNGVKVVFLFFVSVDMLNLFCKIYYWL